MISKVLSCITKQIKQKKKLLLKSLFVLLLWFSFMPQQNYFSFNEVYADTNDGQQAQRAQLVSMDTFMEAISDVAFVLLWPLVALAGLAMDNTLIYWSFMGLDVSLWNIWQIVRSFANYTLWFLFLFGILYWNFSWKDAINGMKLPDLLKKILISSVLIQASWFIMMALVDLSTIMTYSIGWLPYTILGDSSGSSSSAEDSRMFKMYVDLNLWNYSANVENNWDLSDAIVYYWQATWDKYIAPCRVEQRSFWDNESQSFIIWRKFDTFSWGKIKMLPWYCMYYWALISYKDIFSQSTWYQGDLNALDQFIKDKWENDIKALVDAGIIYPVSSWKISYVEKAWDYHWTFERAGNNPVFWCNGVLWMVPSTYSWNEWKCLYNETDISAWNLLKKSSSMTGPFAALYSSFSTYSHLEVKGLWLWQKFVVTFVNVCFAVMLLLPLVALVVVLFARVWLLWVAIALSPFIVLIKVFGKVLNLPKFDYLDFDNLVQLLLAPVFVSFAVWISLVFMTTLKTAIGDGSTAEITVERTNFNKNLSQVSWMTVTDGWDIDFLWFVKIKLDSALLNFSWLLTMFFWIWLSRFLLFWAIKQTKVWSDIWKALQGIWEWALMSTPIIPIGEKWLSLGWLYKMPDRVAEWYAGKFKARSEEWLQSVLDWWSNISWIEKFYENPDISFVDAFNVDYRKTGDALRKMNGLISSGDDWKKKAKVGQVWIWYNSILLWTIQNKDEASFRKVINDINSKVASNSWVTDQINNLIFEKDKVKLEAKLENWKYVIKDLSEKDGDEK